jgi:hypothetical protein
MASTITETSVGGAPAVVKNEMSDVRLANYELRMLDQSLIFCDKKTDKETHKFDFGSTQYKTIQSFNEVTVGTSLLENSRSTPDTPCPKIGIGSRLSYVVDKAES